MEFHQSANFSAGRRHSVHLWKRCRRHGIALFYLDLHRRIHRIILNMTAEAETTVKMFHSPDRDMALEPDGGVQKAKTLPRDSNLASQAFARFERLAGDAIETLAAEIFGGAFD